MNYSQGWTYDTDRPAVFDSAGNLVCTPEGRSESERLVLARRIAFALNHADSSLPVQQVVRDHRELLVDRTAFPAYAGLPTVGGLA